MLGSQKGEGAMLAKLEKDKALLERNGMLVSISNLWKLLFSYKAEPGGLGKHTKGK